MRVPGGNRPLWTILAALAASHAHFKCGLAVRRARKPKIALPVCTNESLFPESRLNAR